MTERPYPYSVESETRWLAENAIALRVTLRYEADGIFKRFKKDKEEHYDVIVNKDDLVSISPDQIVVIADLIKHHCQKRAKVAFGKE